MRRVPGPDSGVFATFREKVRFLRGSPRAKRAPQGTPGRPLLVRIFFYVSGTFYALFRQFLGTF